MSSEYIPLKEWAVNNFGFAPSPATLSAYAKTKQIHPTPVKFARKWMCQKDAKFIGLEQCRQASSGDPLVDRIFNDGCPTQNA